MSKEKQKSQNPGMNVKNLPVAAGVVNPEKNYRKDYSSVPKLKSDIARDGRLLQPVVGVENEDGTWELICGFCRMLSVQQLGWETIPVHVLPEMPSDQERMLMNLRENAARDNLTSFDKAKALCHLHEVYKMSIKDITQSLSGDTTLNQKQVANYIRAVQNLHPDILKDWSERHPLCSTMRLFQLAKHETEQQPAMFDAAVKMEGVILKEAGVEQELIDAMLTNPHDVVAYEKALAGKKSRGVKGSQVQFDEHGNPIAPPPKAKKPADDILEDVIGWLRNGHDNLSAEQADAAIRAIQWVRGKLVVFSIGECTIYDPEADKERREKAKKEKSLEAKAEKMAAGLAELNKARVEAGLPPVQF